MVIVDVVLEERTSEPSESVPRSISTRVEGKQLTISMIGFLRMTSAMAWFQVE